jgi:hypothetical protein
MVMGKHLGTERDLLMEMPMDLHLNLGLLTGKYLVRHWVTHLGLQMGKDLHLVKQMEKQMG